MVLYFCSPGVDDNFADVRYDCYHGRIPKGFNRCSHIIVAWAIGGTAFDFPAHVGYSLGEIDDPIYFVLETHYDNSEIRDDFVDSSGLRLFLTKELRQHDAGMLEVGVKIGRFQIIPPHYESFLSRGVCHESCIENGLGDDEIHVFASLLHTHLLGRKIVTRHVRNGTELQPIMEDNNFDFNYQEFRHLKEERVMKKGDALINDCYYDSSKRSNITYGGLSTKEEMCLSFLLYYPRKPLSVCESRPLYDVHGQYKIFDFAKQSDFTNKSVRYEFTSKISDTEVMKQCLISEKYDFGRVSQPTIDQSYTPKDQCQKI